MAEHSTSNAQGAAIDGLFDIRAMALAGEAYCIQNEHSNESLAYMARLMRQIGDRALVLVSAVDVGLSDPAPAQSAAAPS